MEQATLRFFQEYAYLLENPTDHRRFIHELYHTKDTVLDFNSANYLEVLHTLKAAQIDLLPHLDAIPTDYFADDLELKTYTIPANISIVENRAFLRCRNLKELTIPSSVEAIGTDAFFGCSALTKITYLGRMNQWILVSISSLFNDPLFHNPIHCSDGIVEYNFTTKSWEKA